MKNGKLSMKSNWRQWILGIAALIVIGVTARAAEEGKLLGDGNDGNRSGPTHRIPLLTKIFEDDKAEDVKPTGDQDMPFTCQATCGECHTYETIKKGWHFNSSSPDVKAGRPGEPWVLVDQNSRTVLPLSGRGWKGTHKPADVGVTPWEMCTQFGRHMPGGDYGEKIADAQDGGDWIDASGVFEINCLACHNADPQQDQSLAALLGLRKNYRWIATGSSGIGEVTGMPPDEMFDPLMDEDVKVTYDMSRFDSKKRVFFDIVREVPKNRCYFCHSYQNIDQPKADHWLDDEDIHMTSGMNCVDCHRNGQDHMIIRGYEGEAEKEGKPKAIEEFTCEGCHLGSHTGSEGSGRLSAPKPEHKGIPLVHFEKLTCTACHSGPVPEAKNQRVRTPRIHRLGLHGKHHLDLDLPHVATPVFVKNENDKIGAARMIWPAFWGRIKDDKVTPLKPDAVKAATKAELAAKQAEKKNDWLTLTEEQIGKVLAKLKVADKNEPVYIAGGKLYRVNNEGKVEASEHEAAEPYAWPLAHNVRPAQQSLGVNSCDDCHTTDSNFFFGEVAVHTPVASEAEAVKPMYELAKESGTYWWSFNASFLFRPMLKTIGFVSCGILAVILLLYLMLALHRVFIKLSGQTE
jgi:hypothetical protein